MGRYAAWSCAWKCIRETRPPAWLSLVRVIAPLKRACRSWFMQTPWYRMIREKCPEAGCGGV